MAEFGVDSTSITAPQSVTPVTEGIQKSPLMLEGVNSLLKQGIAIGDAIQNRKGQAALKDFAEKQLNVIRAVEQGAPGFTNTSYARSVMQKNLFDMIDLYGKNPEMRKQILDEHNAILGAADIFGNLSKGTTEEIRRNNYRSNLVTAGYVDPDASEDDFQIAENTHQKAAMAEKSYELQVKQIELNSKALNYSQDKKKAELEAATDTFVHTALPSLVVRFDAEVANIQKSAMTPAQKAQSIAALQQQFQTEQADILLNMSTDKRAAVEKMFTERAKLATDVATGAIDAAAAKTKLDLLKDESVYNALTSSPLIAKAYAMSAIDLQGIATISGSAGLQALDTLGNYLVTNGSDKGNSANLFDNTPEAQSAKTAYFKALTNLGGDSSPEAQAQLETQLSNVVMGIEDYQNLYARDPKAAMALIDWMSTPEFLALRQKHPESFTNVEGAKEALQLNFNDEVWGMVQSEFLNGKVVYPQTMSGVGFWGLMGGPGVAASGANRPEVKPAPEAVTYEFGAAGIRFKAVNPDDKTAAYKAKQLNKDLAPAIMKTIKASAHLSGRTDYDKMFEEVAPMIFSTQSPDGDTGDNLQPSSFNKASGGAKANANVNTEQVSEEASTAWSALTGSWTGPQLTINSGYRSPEYNASVGGAKNSQHTHGNAFDVDVSGMDLEQRKALIRSAKEAGFRGVGVYANSLHFDVGPSRAWGPSYHSDSIPEWAKEVVQ